MCCICQSTRTEMICLQLLLASCALKRSGCLGILMRIATCFTQALHGLNLPYLSDIYYQFNLLFPDHKELFQDLHEVAPKWQNFGVHLKVPFSRIQGIAGGDGTVDRCFTTMLDTWLQGETAPSVDRLVSALQMPGVDQRVLALDINKNKQSEI